MIICDSIRESIRDLLMSEQYFERQPEQDPGQLPEAPAVLEQGADNVVEKKMVKAWKSAKELGKTSGADLVKRGEISIVRKDSKDSEDVLLECNKQGHYNLDGKKISGPDLAEKIGRGEIFIETEIEVEETPEAQPVEGIDYIEVDPVDHSPEDPQSRQHEEDGTRSPEALETEDNSFIPEIPKGYRLIIQTSSTEEIMNLLQKKDSLVLMLEQPEAIGITTIKYSRDARTKKYSVGRRKMTEQDFRSELLSFANTNGDYIAIEQSSEPEEAPVEAPAEPMRPTERPQFYAEDLTPEFLEDQLPGFYLDEDGKVIAMKVDPETLVAEIATLQHKTFRDEQEIADWLNNPDVRKITTEEAEQYIREQENSLESKHHIESRFGFEIYNKYQKALKEYDALKKQDEAGDLAMPELDNFSISRSEINDLARRDPIVKEWLEQNKEITYEELVDIQRGRELEVGKNAIYWSTQDNYSARLKLEGIEELSNGARRWQFPEGSENKAYLGSIRYPQEGLKLNYYPSHARPEFEIVRTPLDLREARNNLNRLSDEQWNFLDAQMKAKEILVARAQSGEITEEQLQNALAYLDTQINTKFDNSNQLQRSWQKNDQIYEARQRISDLDPEDRRLLETNMEAILILGTRLGDGNITREQYENARANLENALRTQLPNFEAIKQDWFFVRDHSRVRDEKDVRYLDKEDIKSLKPQEANRFISTMRRVNQGVVDLAYTLAHAIRIAFINGFERGMTKEQIDNGLKSMVKTRQEENPDLDKVAAALAAKYQQPKYLYLEQLL